MVDTLKRLASQVGDLEEGRDVGDVLEVMPLGAGQEVGRSAVVVKYKGRTVMFDCGVHPAYSGRSQLPYFDDIDPSSVDLLLITHFHLDHSAAVPYFTEKTNFKGRVFMTHPTKAIYKMLLHDYVKVSNIAVEDMLYTEADLMHSMEKIEVINYHQELEHNGIRFWCYNAGHVLGAAMFMVEIGGVKILYTGDFSRQEDRHLMGAETPSVAPDILIVESTYGVQVHESRQAREDRFTFLIHEVVGREGRCLLPVFALGRAQELLLILDEYWETHPELLNIPIYYASTLAKKCMTVYQTFINMMNANIRKRFEVSNPFVFKHISNLRSMEHFDDVGPCVVMASPGMLQSGLSRELFEMWCTDSRNGVILPGYCVEGTLAKHVMSEPSEIKRSDGTTVPLRMSIHYISFSAHSDFLQTSGFIEILKPPNIVLVHGDANEMGRLKTALEQKFSEDKIRVFNPKNCTSVMLRFHAEKMAKVMGQLAEQPPKEGSAVSGVLVKKDFSYTIMAPADLSKFTTLKRSVVRQKQIVPFYQTFSVLRTTIEQMYEDVNVTMIEGKKALQVHEHVTILHNPPNHVVIQWSCDSINDMVADSVLSLILQLEVSPAFIKMEPKSGQEVEEHNMKTALEMLKHQFGDVTLDLDTQSLEVSVDGCKASVNWKERKVDCEDPTLLERVSNSLRRIGMVLYPIPSIS